ncbi:hypothetical protein [Lentibacillus sp. CBA3610]|uniref:hypothetical protein n=1 Tax=Lentibacillus sp. CBA3610 TaxID=2518176 RepID=UPI0015960CE2|nr:hypothetical protein [Lentibacillus sp. CBA3610]QKY71124.1 hypothetical protein Len3610_17550 [Lentibacillus sp. CBA3610]
MAQRNPDAPNQIVLFQELLQDKIEHKPHAARFFSYLAEELDLTYYERLRMGRHLHPPYRNGCYFLRPCTMDIMQLRRSVVCRGQYWRTVDISGMRMPSYKQ